MTPLRPAGTVQIDHHRFDAQAESGLIERGRAVRVIRATGSAVIVREVRESPPGH